MNPPPKYVYLVGAPDLGPACWHNPEACEVDEHGKPPAYLQKAIEQGFATPPVRYVLASEAEAEVAGLKKHLYALLLERAIRNAKLDTPSTIS